jgi:hypothetical protein
MDWEFWNFDEKVSFKKWMKSRAANVTRSTPCPLFWFHRSRLGFLFVLKMVLECARAS